MEQAGMDSWGVGVDVQERAPVSVVPKSGEKIKLTKRTVQEGQASSVAAGDSMEGVLMKDLALGESVLFGAGKTSPVQSMRIEGAKIVIETATSVYEIERS